MARFLISQLEHSKMNGLVCFSLGTAGNLSNQARESCERVCVVCVHLTWGRRGRGDMSLPGCTNLLSI